MKKGRWEGQNFQLLKEVQRLEEEYYSYYYTSSIKLTFHKILLSLREWGMNTLTQMTTATMHIWEENIKKNLWPNTR